VSNDLSAPRSAHSGAIVLVASGIVRGGTGDLPFSVLADGAGTRDGLVAKAAAA
jgi:hypothetical protein